MSESDVWILKFLVHIRRTTDFDHCSASTAIYNCGNELCSQSASANDITRNTCYAVHHTMAASKL